MRKTRILILNYEFPPIGGGGGQSTLELAKGFIKIGYEIDYITSNFKNSFPSYEIINGINVYRVPALGRKELKTANFISMFSYLIFGFFKGISLCLNNKYEMIFTAFVIPTGPLGLVLSKLFKIPHNLNLIGGDIYDPSKKNSPHNKKIWKPVIKFIAENANLITAISSNTKENAIKYFDIKKHIEVISIPYEKLEFIPKTRRELNLDEDKFYIIGVGRLVKRKGFDYLIKAMKGLPPEIHLLILGDGPERETLNNLIIELNLQDQVTLLGYVESDEVKFQYLNVANVFVLSSLHEGFGIVLQEAMQVGLPIISTNYGGQVDFVSSTNGILINPENILELSNSIKNLYNDKKKQIKFRNNNLKLIDSFNSELISLKHINLIK